MKKNCLIALTCLIVICLFSGCSSTPNGKEDFIKNYITDSTEYGLEDLRVVDEDGTIKIIATFDRGTPLDNFVPYTKDIISVSNEAATKKNVAIKYVNTIIYLSDDTYCTYIGWSSENGTLYTDDDRIENIDIDSIDAEIDKLFEEKENSNQATQSHLNIEQVKLSVKNAVIAGTDFTLSYVDVFENKDYSLNVNVGISGKENNDPIIKQFGIYAEQVMNAIQKSTDENKIVVKQIVIGISDTDDMPIVSWITEDGKTGLLSDYRNEKVSYNDVSVGDIQKHLE